MVVLLAVRRKYSLEYSCLGMPQVWSVSFTAAMGLWYMDPVSFLQKLPQWLNRPACHDPFSGVQHCGGVGATGYVKKIMQNTWGLGNIHKH